MRPSRAICPATRCSRASPPPSGSTSASSSIQNDALVELDDNETVAAGIMLTMVAADLYAPVSGGLTDRIRSFRVPGLL